MSGRSVNKTHRKEIEPMEGDSSKSIRVAFIASNLKMTLIQASRAARHHQRLEL
jgi:hypothetical protein